MTKVIVILSAAITFVGFSHFATAQQEFQCADYVMAVVETTFNFNPSHSQNKKDYKFSPQFAQLGSYTFKVFTSQEQLIGTVNITTNAGLEMNGTCLVKDMTVNLMDGVH